jgi:hypothetical protein
MNKVVIYGESATRADIISNKHDPACASNLNQQTYNIIMFLQKPIFNVNCFFFLYSPQLPDHFSYA